MKRPDDLDTATAEELRAYLRWLEEQAGHPAALSFLAIGARVRREQRAKPPPPLPRDIRDLRLSGLSRRTLPVTPDPEVGMLFHNEDTDGEVIGVKDGEVRLRWYSEFGTDTCWSIEEWKRRCRVYE